MVSRFETPNLVTYEGASRNNLKSYGISNFDQLIKGIRIGIFKMDEKGGYDLEFKSKIEDFQGKNRLSRTDGFLDMNTLVEMYDFYKKQNFSFWDNSGGTKGEFIGSLRLEKGGNLSIREIINEYKKGTLFQKKIIIAETTEQLSEEEKEQMFSQESLKSIGVSIPQAINLAVESIDLGQGRTKITKQDIKVFQKNHNLDVDGIVGDETYLEMKAGEILENVKTGINLGIPKGERREIIDLLNTKGCNLLGKNVRDLFICIELFRDSSDPIVQWKIREDKSYEVFFREIGLIKKAFIESPEGEKILNHNKENFESIYGTIKNPNLTTGEKIEKIVKNPTILFAAGILFLFGVIEGDSKYTNSFMKRLGWILGGTIFLPALWREFGGGEILEDMSSGVDSAVELSKKMIKKFGEGYETGKSKAGDIFEDGLGGSLGSLFNKASFDKTYDKFSVGIYSYNESLKEISDGENYIEVDKFNEIRNILFSDEKFFNSSKDDLIKKDYTDLISEDSKTKLNELYLGEGGKKSKDLNNFINNHVLKHSFKEGDNFVKDIFMTSEFKKTIDDFKYKNSKYAENPKLRGKIQKEIVSITNVGSLKQKNAGKDLQKSILEGDINSFNIENYSLTSSEKEKVQGVFDEIKMLIEADGKFKEKNKEIDVFVSKIVGITIIDSGLDKDNGDTVIGKYKEAMDIGKNFKEIDFGKVSTYLNSEDFNVSKFDVAFHKKQVELLKKAKELGKTEIDSKPIEDLLNELGQKQQKIEDKEQSSTLPEDITVPPKGAEEKEFLDFLNNNYGYFTLAKKLSESNDKSSKSKAKNVLVKFGDFVKNLTYKLNDRSKEISDLKTSVDGITYPLEASLNSESIKTKLANLKDLEDKYNKVRNEISGLGIDDKVKSWLGSPDRNQNIYILINSKVKSIDNSKGIDGTSLQNSINGLKDSILDERNEIFSKLEMDIDFGDNIKDKAKIQTELNKLLILEDFVDDNKKLGDAFKGKKQEIAEKLNNLVDLYIEKINSSNLDDIKSIKENFQDTVVKHVNGDKLVGIFKKYFGEFKVFSDKFNGAYKNRVEKLIDEMSNDSKLEFVNDFFYEYCINKKDVDVLKILGGNNKIDKASISSLIFIFENLLKIKESKIENGSSPTLELDKEVLTATKETLGNIQKWKIALLNDYIK